MVEVKESLYVDSMKLLRKLCDALISDPKERGRVSRIVIDADVNNGRAGFSTVVITRVMTRVESDAVAAIIADTQTHPTPFIAGA